MRLEKWFISNLDDSQRQIIVRDPNENLIVQGTAGSGKTNLAIHRAMQASAFGTYAIIIYTIALKRMVAYGMAALGLDKEKRMIGLGAIEVLISMVLYIGRKTIRLVYIWCRI